MKWSEAVHANIDITTITSHYLCMMLLCLVTRCPSMKATRWIFCGRSNGAVQKSATQVALQSTIFSQGFIINKTRFASIVTSTRHKWWSGIWCWWSCIFPWVSLLLFTICVGGMKGRIQPMQSN